MRGEPCTGNIPTILSHPAIYVLFSASYLPKAHFGKRQLMSNLWPDRSPGGMTDWNLGLTSLRPDVLSLRRRLLLQMASTGPEQPACQDRYFASGSKENSRSIGRGNSIVFLGLPPIRSGTSRYSRQPDGFLRKGIEAPSRWDIPHVSGHFGGKLAPIQRSL